MLESMIGLIENYNLRFISDATEFKEFWSLGFADIRDNREVSLKSKIPYTKSTSWNNDFPPYPAGASESWLWKATSCGLGSCPVILFVWHDVSRERIDWA